MAIQTYNLGPVTAYGDAVAAGYTGTKAQWQALMANYATVGTQATQSAQMASTAAQTATTKASEASASATAAQEAAESVLDPDRYNLVSAMNPSSGTSNGITYTWTDGSCRITGTSTAVTFNNLFMSSDSLPSYISAGDVLYVKYKSTNVSFIVYDYSGGTITKLTEVKRDTIFKIPSTCTGLIIRLWIANGTTVNETVSPKIYVNDNCLIESVDTATASESGKTDMRYIIGDMLSIYGYCQLGPGAFYISGYINMPEGSTLEGCGEATKIYLTSGNNKAAIRMNRYCTVKDLCVIGSYNDLAQSSFSATAGTRYGIQYYKESGDATVPATCKISNVHIKNFTGGGIYQYGTGANVEQGLLVSDVNIKNCWCGIWIYSNSEFCRYNNVQVTYCYIACINNGGNNAFDNCVFHAYTVGMKIDGTQNNSAHGMCSNSSFCHVGDNSGSALTLADIAHGYVFSSCQFWYNSIDISDCGGIVFSGCEIGRSAAININGGNTVMFGDCVFMNDVAYPPSINITNNTKVEFTGCYGSVSGNPIGENSVISQIEEELSNVANATYVTDSASGAVAHFVDGADGVPMKSVKVNIEPVQSGSGDPSPSNVRAISGWDAVKVYRSGENTEEATEYNITLASAGTVYGGTLDAVSGELTVDRAIKTFNGSEAWYLSNGGMRCQTPMPSDAKSNSADSTLVGAISNEFVEISPNRTWDGASGAGFCIDTNRQLNVCQTGQQTMTVEAWKTWLASHNMQIVYPLATPVTYNLTPTEVKSLLGINNIWSDAGDVEVEYRADTKLYIDKRLAEVTA